jgi:hypothetical protein
VKLPFPFHNSCVKVLILVLLNVSSLGNRVVPAAIDYTEVMLEYAESLVKSDHGPYKNTS